MQITRKCRLNGKSYTMEIPSLTPEKLAELELARSRGVPIQVAAPTLSIDEREFLITGTPPDVWNSIFGEKK